MGTDFRSLQKIFILGNQRHCEGAVESWTETKEGLREKSLHGGLWADNK
jgi:hypothetical protein